jgi:hypothetical protein
MNQVTRLTAKLNRMWSRRSLQEVKRMQKRHSDLRECLHKVCDRKIDRMRWGLKDYKTDTIQLRYGFRKSYPDCPRLMYK